MRQMFFFLIEVIRVDGVVNISPAISQGVVVEVFFVKVLVMVPGLFFLLMAFIWQDIMGGGVKGGRPCNKREQ